MRQRAAYAWLFIGLAASAVAGCACEGVSFEGPDMGFDFGTGPQDGGPGPNLDGGLGGADVFTTDGGNQDCTVGSSDKFEPALECRWSGEGADDPYPGYFDVVMTPVVANLTDDNGDGLIDTADVPDIAFISYDLINGGCCSSNGVLRIVSGDCSGDDLPVHAVIGRNEIVAQTDESVWLDNSGGLALANLDGDDGGPDIVAMLNGGGTIAFENNVPPGEWTVKWINTVHPDPSNDDSLSGAQPAVADLDGDGDGEVIVGRIVLDGATGELLFAGNAGRGINAFLGPVSVVADVDVDGELDILAGGTRYDSTATEICTFDFDADGAWPAPGSCGNTAPGGCDGFDAIGNFDADDDAEIVIVRRGVVYIMNPDCSVLTVGTQDAVVAIPVDDCADNEGGPPTVADFDCDDGGQVEIGVAAGDFYTVLDLDCLVMPLPSFCEGVGVRWTAPNQDCSSRVTSSSVFDFNGDGAAEVVYNDEVSFRVFDGATGAILVDEFNGSHTRLEMPVIVDVDNDGNAEVVFAENRSNGGDPGVEVWGDPFDAWVPTRRIWNQHAYHITNVNEDGSLPSGGESPNWLEPTDATEAGVMNNFRQNLPDFDPFAAPDLVVDVASFDYLYCPSILKISINVCNVGALFVGPGISVSVFDATGDSFDEIDCDEGNLETTSTLEPGQCQVLTCSWSDPPTVPDAANVTACVDNDGPECAAGAKGGNNECNEDNNLDTFVDEGCPDLR